MVKAMTYRKLITEDERAAAASLVACFFDELRQDPEARDYCMKQLAAGMIEAWGAFDHNGMMVGTLGYSLVRDLAMVQFIWFFPEYRGGQAGGLLYRAAEKSLPGHIRNIHIFVEPSREVVYSKLGFEKQWAIMRRRVRHGHASPR